MKVRVEKLLCGQTGYCVKTAPRVFRLPDGESAEVILENPPAELGQVVLEAEALCPTKAIHVET